MATTSVPVVWANLSQQLRVRPGLAGVPVRTVDLGMAAWTDTEAIVWTRAAMTGAALLGWGAGPGSLATIEPITLSGYLYTALGGDSDDKAAAALTRAGELLTEVAQQLRDDPTINGALQSLTVTPTRWQPPVMTNAVWSAWQGDVNGVAVVRVAVDFTVTWQAINT